MSSSPTIPAEITSELISAMAARIVELFSPEKIVLFGSQATGCTDVGSDVDLLVIADLGLSPRESALAIRRALADFHVACDVIAKTPAEYAKWRGVVNHIVHIADRDGRVLYERRAA